MREIKFRGFHKFGNVKGWVYGYLLKDGHDYYIQPDAHTSYNVEPKSIGQLVGLYDKIKHPIYEGDILVRSHDKKSAFVAVIEFKNGMFGGKTMPHANHFLEMNRLNKCDCDGKGYDKIIGNIYENPELLTP